MASVNKVILIGNLGDNPDVRFTSAGLAIANISLATTNKWKDRDGEPQEETEWHKVVFFGKLAEIVQQYCHKGKQIYIEGRLQTKMYEKDGVKHYPTKIIANEMKMLGSKSNNNQAIPTKPEAVINPSTLPPPIPADDLDELVPF